MENRFPVPEDLRMKFRLILKGKPDSGKTELLIHSLSDIRLISGGYVFLKLESSSGETKVGVAKAAEAAAASFPYEDYSELEYNKESYFRLLEGQLQQIQELGFGYMDQILGAELENEPLAEELKKILQEDIPVAAILGPEETTGNRQRYQAIMEMLEQDENTEIYDLDQVSGQEAVRKIRDWAESVLDWAHHKKFDPLMQLRARRKRQNEFQPDFSKTE